MFNEAIPVFSPLVAALCVLVFLSIEPPSPSGPCGITVCVAEKREWSALFLFGFVHSNLAHLSLNLVGFFVFGWAVEQKIGSKAFFLLFICVTFGAAIAFSVVFAQSDLGSLRGASSATAAVIALYLWLWSSQMKPPLSTIIQTILILVTVLTAGAGLTPAPTCHACHAIGMAFGICFGVYATKRPLI